MSLPPRPAACAPLLEIELTYSPAPRQIVQRRLRLPGGSTVGDALKAAGLASPVASAGGQVPWTVGVWGRPAALEQPLCALDRVELWRPLRVDPKLARRERFGQQGARAAGLFAKRRPGAKPGY